MLRGNDKWVKSDESAKNNQKTENKETIAENNFWYPVYKNGSMEYINNKGQLVTNSSFSPENSYSLVNFKSDFLIVSSGEKKGVLTKTGKWVIQPEYNSVLIDEESKMIKVGIKENGLTFGEKIGWFDYSGNQVIPVKICECL
jgi:hypothetical protein